MNECEDCDRVDCRQRGCIASTDDYKEDPLEYIRSIAARDQISMMQAKNKVTIENLLHEIDYATCWQDMQPILRKIVGML